MHPDLYLTEFRQRQRELERELEHQRVHRAAAIDRGVASRSAGTWAIAGSGAAVVTSQRRVPAGRPMPIVAFASGLVARVLAATAPARRAVDRATTSGECCATA